LVPITFVLAVFTTFSRRNTIVSGVELHATNKPSKQNNKEVLIITRILIHKVTTSQEIGTQTANI
jgi:hypothetical protein